MTTFRWFCLMAVFCFADGAQAQLFNGKMNNAIPISSETTFALRGRVDGLYRRVLRANAEGKNWGQPFEYSNSSDSSNELGRMSFPFGLLVAEAVRSVRYKVDFGPRSWSADSGWVQVRWYVGEAQGNFGRLEFMWKITPDRRLIGHVYGNESAGEDSRGNELITVYRGDPEFLIDQLFLALFDVEAIMDRMEFEPEPILLEESEER